MKQPVMMKEIYDGLKINAFQGNHDPTTFADRKPCSRIPTRHSCASLPANRRTIPVGFALFTEYFSCNALQTYPTWDLVKVPSALVSDSITRMGARPRFEQKTSLIRPVPLDWVMLEFHASVPGCTCHRVRPNITFCASRHKCRVFGKLPFERGSRGQPT